MSTRVDLEEIESTRSEKALALVLVVFLLIGTLWFYAKVDNWVTGAAPSWEYTPAEQAVLDRQMEAWEKNDEASRELESAKTDLETSRENLNLAIAQDENTDDEEKALDAAEDEFDAARAAEEQAFKESQAADDAVAAMEKKREEMFQEPTSQEQWIIAGIRLGFVIAWISAGFVMLGRLRSRQSRFLALAFSVLAAGVITSLVFAVDYITDWIDWRDLGPLVLSIFGVIVTVIAFISLQRYLTKRIPARRVRKGDCPFCGYPIRGTAGEEHCEGCGREVVAPCSSCAKPRRVGANFCAVCGSA